METWVLFISVSAGLGQTVATVPGYRSDDECFRAGVMLQSVDIAERNRSKEPAAARPKIEFRCFIGPKADAKRP